jgi:Tfp pilus assembly protein PilF
MTGILTVLEAAIWLALCQTPPDLNNRMARGYQFLDEGRLEDAHRELSMVVGAAPKSVDARILLGMASYHLQRDSEAVANLEEALRLAPGSVQAQYVLGMVYLRTQQLEVAEKYLVSAYAAEPAREDILQALTQTLMAKGDAPALAGWLAKGRAVGIESPGLLMSLGWAYSQMQDFPKAEEAAAAGLKLNPQSRPGWLTLIKAQLQQGEPGRVRALATLAQSRQVPALAEGWQHPYLVGLANYMLDRHEAAVDPLRTAAARAPEQGPIHLLLALCLTTAGDDADAERHHRRAIELDSRNALFHYYYGLFLRHQEKLERAEGEFRAALNADARLAEAQMNLGLMLDKAGKESEGVSALEHAITLAPDLARAYYVLGRIYIRRKETDRGAAMLRRFGQLKAGEAEQSRHLILAGAISTVGPR